MVAHIKPVSEIDDWTALYDQTNWEVRCIGCEQELNRQAQLEELEHGKN